MQLLRKPQSRRRRLARGAKRLRRSRRDAAVEEPIHLEIEQSMIGKSIDTSKHWGNHDLSTNRTRSTACSIDDHLIDHRSSIIEDFVVAPEQRPQRGPRLRATAGRRLKARHRALTEAPPSDNRRRNPDPTHLL
jgi:hypothetical protein